MSWFVTSVRFGAAGLVVALGALSGGCSDLYLDRRDTIALSAGDALASDKAVQMIDPWPPKSGNRKIAFNGQRMQAAMVRYRTNRVIEPRPLTTNSVVPADAQTQTPTAAAAAPSSTPAGQ
ncbi:MAG: hypothetical protein ACLPKB_33995 [Xanthobacteraceae bacterium]